MSGLVGGVAAQIHGWEGATADLDIAVAAPDDILRSKQAAGRDKDLAALPQMPQDFRDSGAL